MPYRERMTIDIAPEASQRKRHVCADNTGGATGRSRSRPGDGEGACCQKDVSSEQAPLLHAPPFPESSARHALPQAAFLEESLLQAPDLLIQQIVGHLDQTDDHVGGDRRIGVFNAFAEMLVGGVRGLVELAQAMGVGMISR